MGRVRTLVALVLVAALSACSGTMHPRGPDLSAPGLGQGEWTAPDGTRAPLRSWLPPESEIRAVLLALHGMNDYSNAFEAPGRALADMGVATYAPDQRGFGQGPHAGEWSSSETMASDAVALAGLLRGRHPGRPLYLLGESMGGAVAILASTRDGERAPADGLILAAPAVWGRSSMGWAQRVLLWGANALVPGLTLTGRGLGIQASDNIEMLRALSRDPLVIKETRVDAIHGLVDLMDAAQESVWRLDLPLLLLYGELDQVIPASPTWEAVSRLPDLGATQRAALYDRGWHMLLRDLQAQVVIKDIAAWAVARDTPLPSGADVRASARLGR